ncbi:phospholipase B-like 1 isoform X2 [Haliotis rufescens]|uniref:phospholipase B-like 1 isoform X2 n=1 Tax=Haliotis rufescens TaxID=6454 RepID=UPI00201F182C|nr:phospholipase B-like 1 isoform X2 [Haliotis rufescens]
MFVYLFTSIAVSVVYGGDVLSGSVYCKHRECAFTPGLSDKQGATAYGVFNDTLEEKGWAQLDIRAGYGRQATDADVMFAAGYLEGVLTSRRIYQHFQNVQYPFFLSQTEAAVAFARKFLYEQDRWTRDMILQFSSTDSFWRQVGHVTDQLDGLYTGYNSVSTTEEEKLDFFIFQALSASGDLSDIMAASNSSQRPDWRTMTRAEVDRFLLMGSRCSALVKVTDNFDDIFMGHSTWFLYQTMLRIYKYWTFKLRDETTKMSFSSYPGLLVSVDDFYVMSDTSMVMLQTTNDIFNASLFSLIQPHSLLAWQRVRVANMAATSGPEWAEMYKRYNSGTYMNQYMVIDLKRYQPRKHLEDNLLWVVEQIPGLVIAADQTAILRKGYWASYNVPFYESIYNISGYPEFVSVHGSDYSYEMAPRAKIFRRDHSTVHDVVTARQLLRSNDYVHDPFSEDNACYAVCCRGDLVTPVPMAFGCIDTKVTDFNLALNSSASIINGPTTTNHMEPFDWSKEFENISHIGLPQRYDFSFYDVYAML